MKRIFKATLFGLALLLVLMGSAISVAAFTQTSSALAKSSTKATATYLHKSAVPDAGCFPGYAYWTWVSSGNVFQAWMALDTTPYKHVNFHVQHYCGGDIRNYHITYNGNGTWSSYDSVSGENQILGNSNIYICDSMSVAASQQATAAGNSINSPYGQDLANKSALPAWEGMNRLIGGIC